MFITVFALTYSVPDWIETYGANYIERKAQQRTDRVIDSFQPPEGEGALSRLARSVYDKNEERIEGLRTQLKDSVNEKWASAMASIRDLDCECRKQWEDIFENSFLAEISLARAVNEKITGFIHSSYMGVVEGLKQDIRIFTGGNAVAFLLVLLISFFQPRANSLLFLPALLLMISTLACSYFYLFQQDWLLTIIQGSYVGYAYLGWLSVVFLFLTDIVFLRGEMTAGIINGMLEALGSAVTVDAC